MLAETSTRESIERHIPGTASAIEELLVHRTKAEVFVAMFRGVADILELIEARRLDAL